MTINPVSSAYPVESNQVSQAVSRQPQPQPSKSNAMPEDTVTLRGAGDTDYDGDSK